MSDVKLSNKEFFDYILLSRELNGSTKHYINVLYDVDIDLVGYLKDSVNDSAFGNYLDIINLIVKNSKSKEDIKDKCDKLFDIKNSYKKYKIDLALFRSFVSRISLELLLKDVITDDRYKPMIDKGKVIEVNSLSDIKFRLSDKDCKVSACSDESFSLEIGDKIYKDLGMLTLNEGRLCRYTRDIMSEDRKKEIINNSLYELVIIRGVY